MSDTDVDPGYLNYRRAADANLSLAPDTSADDAARSIELEDMTGANASYIARDVNDFENRHKLSLSQNIIGSNPDLMNYVNAHPLFSSVSQDDWGNLDAVSEAHRKITDTLARPWWKRDFNLLVRGAGGGVSDVLGGIGRVTGSENLTAKADQIKRAIQDQFPLTDQEQVGMMAQAITGLGALIPMAVAGVGAAAVGPEAALATLPFGLGEIGVGAATAAGVGGLEHAGEVAEQAEKAHGDVKGAYAGSLLSSTALNLLPLGIITRPWEAAAPGLINWGSNALKRWTVGGGAQAAVSELGAAIDAEIARGTYDPSAQYKPDTERMMTNFLMGATMGASYDAVKAYLDAGAHVPPGINPILDQLRFEQTRVSNKDLDELIRSAASTQTGQRGVGGQIALDQFLKLLPDASIGLDRDQVLKLYADKQPEPNDGILGWVHDIGNQLSKQTGDIRVSLADYVHHSQEDPELAKEFKDHVRIGLNGLSLDDIKNMAQSQQTENEQRAALLETPETPRYLGGLSDTGAPVLDSINKSMGLDKILPVPPEFWRSRPKGIVGRSELGVTNAGATVEFLHNYDENNGEKRKAGVMVPLKIQGQTTGKQILAGLNLDKMPEETRKLMQFFKERVTEAAGDVPIYLLKEKDIENKLRDGVMKAPAGYHDPDPRKPEYIVLNSDAMGRYNDEYLAHVVIHEMAHAATVHQMYANTAFMRLAQDMMETTRAWVEDNQPRLIDMAFPREFSHDVEYAFTNSREFIAQAYSAPDFMNVIGRVPLPDEIRMMLGFERERGTMWDGIRHFIKKALEDAFGIKIPSSIMDGVLRWGELVREAQTGVPEPVVGEPTKPPVAPPPQPPIPPGEPIEPPIPEPELFESYKVLGYTKKHYAQVMKLLSAELDKNLAWRQEQAQKDAERRVTQWWKDEEIQMEPDARQAVYQRPVIAAERFLRNGMLGADKLTRRKLDGNLLTQDQRDTLNPEYWSFKRGNLDPDSIAGLFGYRSGQEMISDLIGHSQDMQRENMAPTTYINSLVSGTLKQMMEAKHGTLQENILKEAQDHIISEGKFDLLHEDMLRIATKAGLQAPMTKEGVKQAAIDELNSTTRGHESAEKMVDDMGKVGRQIEQASTLGKWKDAFELAQKRQILFWKVHEMRDFEDLEAKGLSVTKKHVQREPTAFKDSEAAPYHNFIQAFMNKFGMRTSTDLDDIMGRIQKGNFTSFRDFVNKMEKNWGVTIPAPDFLQDVNFNVQQKLKSLTIGQSNALWQTLVAMDKMGRWTRKINVQGSWLDIAGPLQNMYDELDATGKVDLPSTLTGPWSKMLHKLKVFDASSRIVERFFNRIDKDNPRGPMNQLLSRPITEAANHENTLDRTYGTRFRALGTPEDFMKVIEAPPMLRHTDGRPLTSFTNMNKLAIALNMGNDNNWWKFTDGRRMSDEQSAQLWQWMIRNMSDKEWTWVQGVWDIFKDIKQKELDPVYLRTTGFPPRDIAARAFNTMSGKVMDGGYYPLMSDHQDIGEGSRTGLEKVDNGPDFMQMNIPNPHAKERTGVTYPLTLSMDHLPDRFYQLIHDVAFKEALGQAKKILSDTGLQNRIIQHYGTEYLDAIKSWLVRASGAKTFNSAAAVEGNKMSEFLRQNVMSFYVGFNIGTVLKHGPTALINSARQIGADNLLRGYANMYRTNPETGESWKQFIDENSEEIQRRGRDWAERFGGAYKDFTQGTLREKIIEWGSKPVAFSDMLSAYPTWLGAYLKARDEGLDFGEARFEADRAVRYAHGSTAPTNLPEIATGGGIHAWITSLYHFFGTMLQNRMEIAFKLNDMYNLGARGDLKRAAAILPALVADVFAYVVWPTAVEEYVTGLGRDDRRGLGQRLAWATAGGLANSVIYARDIVHALEYGVSQEGGLLDSVGEPLHKAWRDTVGHYEKGKPIFTRQYAGNLIQDFINLTSYPLGTPRELGNLAKYGYNYEAGIERPRTGIMKDWYQWGDVGRGLTHGSQKMSVVKQ